MCLIEAVLKCSWRGFSFSTWMRSVREGALIWSSRLGALSTWSTHREANPSQAQHPLRSQEGGAPGLWNDPTLWDLVHSCTWAGKLLPLPKAPTPSCLQDWTPRQRRQTVHSLGTQLTDVGLPKPEPAEPQLSWQKEKKKVRNAT